MPLEDLADVEIKHNGKDVSAGPMRWARAQRWAEKWPNSKHGKLFLDRVAVKDRVLNGTQDIEFGTVFVYESDLHAPSIRRKHACTVECMAMLLQLEGQLGVDKLIELIRLATQGLRPVVNTYTITWGDQKGNIRVDSRMDRVDVSTLKKPKKCFVCGLPIGPVKEEQQTPPVVDQSVISEDVETPSVCVAGYIMAEALAPGLTDPAADSKEQYLIAGDGTMIYIPAGRVVSLTSEEANLLANYSTPELRAQYAATYGQAFA